jgi:hypothetical protein
MRRFCAMVAGIRSDRVASTSGTNGKSPASTIDSDPRESGMTQASGNRCRKERNKGAVLVDGAMQPAIIDFECEKVSAGTKNAMDFGKGAILQLWRAEMMNYQNGDGRRKGAVREGQRRGVASYNTILATTFHGAKVRAKSRVVFEAGDLIGAPAKFAGGGAGSGTNFQHMIAQGSA